MYHMTFLLTTSADMADSFPMQYIPEHLHRYTNLESIERGDKLNPGDENTPEATAAYIFTHVAFYKNYRTTGRSLWSAFKSDFKGWSSNTFQVTNQGVLQYLRDHLLCHGVYIPHDQKLVSQNLEDVLHHTSFRSWTEEEVQTTLNRYTLFRRLAQDQAFLGDISQSPTLPLIRTPRDDEDTRPAKPTIEQLHFLAVVYTDSMKYGAELYDIFETKLMIFRHTCRKVDINEQQAGYAFQFMLKGEALLYYLEQLSNPGDPHDLQTLATRMKSRFETDYKLDIYLHTWLNTKLHHIIQDNPKRSTLECFEILVSRLANIQRGLPEYHGSESALRLQLLFACRNIWECRLCVREPPVDLQAFIERMRLAIIECEWQ